MSNLTKWGSEVLAHLKANPAAASADLAAQGEVVLAGLENVAQDVPKLVVDGETIGPLLVKLIMDLIAKNYSPADALAFVRAIPPVIADLRKTLADFKAGEAAATP